MRAFFSCLLVLLLCIPSPYLQAEPDLAELRKRTLDHVRSLVRQALKEAEAIENPTERDFVLADSAGLLAATGDIRQAFGITAQIRSESSRESALGEIALVQAAHGDPVAALETIKGFDPEREITAATLVGIAISQARAGDVPGAFRTLDKLPKDCWGADCWKSSGLSWVAAAQANQGDFVGALQTSHLIEEARTRVGAVMGLAEIQAKKDEAAAAATFQLAIQGAMALESGYEKGVTLQQIASAQAKAGLAEAANSTFELALRAAADADPDWAADLLTQIAEAQWATGRGDAAEQTLREAHSLLSQPNERTEKGDVLADIALLQAHMGKWQEAEETARSIGDDFWREEALRRVDEVRKPTRDDLAGLLKRVQSCPDGPFKTMQLARIARSQGEAGDVDGALRWIGEEKSSEVKARALISLAEGLMERLEPDNQARSN